MEIHKQYITSEEDSLSAGQSSAGSIAQEGQYAYAGQYTTEHGEDYEGFYHSHDNVRMAGWTHDESHPTAWMTYPTPDDADWHKKLGAGE